MNKLIVLALIVAVAIAAPSGKSAGTYPSAPIHGISYVQTPSVAAFTQPMLQVAAIHPSGYAVNVDDDDDKFGGIVLSEYTKKSSDSGEDDDNNNDDEGSNEGGKGKGKDQGSGEDDGDRGHGKGSGHSKGAEEEEEKEEGGKKGHDKGSGHDNDDDKKYSLSSTPLWGSTAGVISTGVHGAPITGPTSTLSIHRTLPTLSIHQALPALSTNTGTLGVMQHAVPSVSAQSTWTSSAQNVARPSAVASIPATPAVSSQTTYGTGTLELSALSVPSSQTAWAASRAQNLAFPSFPGAPSTQTMYGTYQPTQTQYEAKHTSLPLPTTSGQLVSAVNIEPALHRQQTTIYGVHPTVQTQAALLQPISASRAGHQETLLSGAYSKLPSTSIHGAAVNLPQYGQPNTAAIHPGSILTTYSEQGPSNGPKSHSAAAGSALRIYSSSATSGTGLTSPHQKSGYTGRITRH